MTTLNLHHIAAEVFHDSVSPDPGVMAGELVARLRPEDYREALLLLARDYMRLQIRNGRDGRNGGAPHEQGSHRVAAARDAWKRLLDTPEFVPSAGWLFLRDATTQQVLEMAKLRVEKSHELAKAADRYRALAEAMKHKKVLRVADLPDDILETLLGAEAAA